MVLKNDYIMKIKFLILLFTLLYISQYAYSQCDDVDFTVFVSEGANANPCEKTYFLELQFSDPSLMLEGINISTNAFDEVTQVLTSQGSGLGFIGNGNMFIVFGNNTAEFYSGTRILEYTVPMEAGDCLSIGDFTTSISIRINGELCSFGPTEIQMTPDPSTFCLESNQVCGNVQHANGHCDDTEDASIAGATVSIDDGCGNIIEAETDENGNYCIKILSELNGQEYCPEISIDNSDCPPCETAHTNHDLIFINEIMNVIHGLPHNLTREQLLAANIFDKDGFITALDIFRLIQLVNGSDVEVDGCRFYPSSELEGEHTNGFSFEGNACGDEDFIMVVPGDLNGNCSGCIIEGIGPGPVPDTEVVSITEDSGQLYFSMKNNYNGLVLTLDVSSEFNEDDFVILDNENISSSYLISDETLFISFFKLDPYEVTEEPVLTIAKNSVILNSNNHYCTDEESTYTFQLNQEVSLRSNTANQMSTRLFINHNELVLVAKTDMDAINIDIFSIDGHRVTQYDFNDVKHHEESRMNIDGLSGLYMINIQTNQGQNTTKIYIP